MEFIVGLLEASNKSVMMVIVDHLVKYAHSCALPHPFTPTLVVYLFMYQIFKFHGMPTFIVSNHKPTFTGKFW